MRKGNKLTGISIEKVGVCGKPAVEDAEFLIIKNRDGKAGVRPPPPAPANTESSVLMKTIDRLVEAVTALTKKCRTETDEAKLKPEDDMDISKMTKTQFRKAAPRLMARLLKEMGEGASEELEAKDAEATEADGGPVAEDIKDQEDTDGKPVTKAEEDDDEAKVKEIEDKLDEVAEKAKISEDLKEVTKALKNLTPNLTAMISSLRKLADDRDKKVTERSATAPESTASPALTEAKGALDGAPAAGGQTPSEEAQLKAKEKAEIGAAQTNGTAPENTGVAKFGPGGPMGVETPQPQPQMAAPAAPVAAAPAPAAAAPASDPRVDQLVQQVAQLASVVGQLPGVTAKTIRKSRSGQVRGQDDETEVQKTNNSRFDGVFRTITAARGR